VTLHTQVDSPGGEGIRSFEIAQFEDYRMLRLTMTGPSQTTDHVLSLSAFEIFGTFRPGNFWTRPVSPTAIPWVEGKKDEPLRGILAYCTKQCGGCVHRLSVVIVTASSIAQDRSAEKRSYEPVNATAVCDSSTFQSCPEPGGWLCYDFYDKMIRIEHYALKSQGSPGGGKDSCNLKSWRVEGSPDGTHWTILDTQTDSDVLNGRGAVKAFKITVGGDYRFVRLVQTGLSWTNKNVIWISAFELYGQMICQ
jgi:hypothetical protein